VGFLTVELVVFLGVVVGFFAVVVVFLVVVTGFFAGVVVFLGVVFGLVVVGFFFGAVFALAFEARFFLFLAPCINSFNCSFEVCW